MAQTQYRETLKVDRDKFFSVIVKYEDYPQFVDGCQTVEVDRDGKEVQVSYHVQVMSKDVHYTLRHKEDSSTGKVSWELVESNFFKKNSGSWTLAAAGDGETDVTYAIEVEFKVPVPGFLLNKVVKSGLPGMVKSFRDRATGG